MGRLKRRESGLIVVVALVCVGALLLTRPGLVSRSRPAPPPPASSEPAREPTRGTPSGSMPSPEPARDVPPPVSPERPGSPRATDSLGSNPEADPNRGPEAQATPRSALGATPGASDAAGSGPGRVVTATTVEELVAKIAEGGVTEARLMLIREEAEAFFAEGERGEPVTISRLDEALRTLAWTDIAFDPETGRIAITLDPAAPLTGLSIVADAFEIGPDGRPTRIYMRVD